MSGASERDHQADLNAVRRAVEDELDIRVRRHSRAADFHVHTGRPETRHDAVSHIILRDGGRRLQRADDQTEHEYSYRVYEPRRFAEIRIVDNNYSKYAEPEWNESGMSSAL